MKKTIIILSIILVILACALALIFGFPIYKNFEINNAQKIVVTSISGERVEVTDADTAQQITDNITSIKFKRGKSSKNTNGFGPIITWYDASGNVIEAISVMGEQSIMYDGYFWTAADGRIDTAVLYELLK